ncbi:MAG: nucleotidyl transferase AbiEii/AbiGii toxin family protein [Candidatus Aminicenantes bacterium]|nr:nucleotidyl transferase AbiEii/AbiGii toxin family protein [Candidatus Aminicenantes bacterium]
MNRAIANLLENYDLKTQDDYEIAIKEIIHQLALLGLWRSRFYEHASFYGGTALRIFYGLKRFSEDLDFSLLKKNDDFDIIPHLKAVETEIESYGFKFSVEKRDKVFDSQIESAFIKGNTRINLLCINAQDNIVKGFDSDRKIKIKLEIDTDPPGGSEHEVKTLLYPIPFSIKVFTRPNLFAGKMHAVLCRQWKSRVKGRDFYDLVWYIGQKIPCRIEYLKERMIQTGHWKREDNLDKSILLHLLQEKLKAVDIEQIKKDVQPFLKDKQELDLWSRDFFLDIIESIEII